MGLGAKLNLWKGQVKDENLEWRWQELAWRVNLGLHRAATPTGDRLIAFLDVLAAAQKAVPSASAELLPTIREHLVAKLAAPEGVQAARFPTKRTAGMRRVWRTLRDWSPARHSRASDVPTAGARGRGRGSGG